MPNSCSGPRVTERLTIARLGHRGDGIADTPQGPVYVPYVLPGETRDGRAGRRPSRPPASRACRPSRATSASRRSASISPNAAAAPCSTGRWPNIICGSAGWSSRRWRRPASIAPVEPLIDAHGAGRRRAVLHARRGAHDVLEVGFTAPRAHHIVAIDACPILAPGLDGAIKAAWAHRRDAQARRQAARHPGDRDRQRPRHRPARLRPAVARRDDGAGAARRPAQVSPVSPVTANWSRSARRRCSRSAAPTCALPPGAFLQATAAGEAALARAGARACRRRQARRRSVLRRRPLRAAAGRAGARHRRRQRRGRGGRAQARRRRDAAASSRSRRHARDLFRRPLAAAELKGFDAVVFDPPRQGAEAQARELAKSAVPVVVAVSCNAATFARDARILVDGGYRLDARHAGRPVPLFVSRRDRGEVRTLTGRTRIPQRQPEIFPARKLACRLTRAMRVFYHHASVGVCHQDTLKLWGRT